MKRSHRSSLWNLRKAVSPTAIHLPEAPTGSTTTKMCYLCTRSTCHPSPRSFKNEVRGRRHAGMQPAGAPKARCGRGRARPTSARARRAWRPRPRGRGRRSRTAGVQVRVKSGHCLQAFEEVVGGFEAGDPKDLFATRKDDHRRHAHHSIFGNQRLAAIGGAREIDLES